MEINLPNNWSPRDYQIPLWNALAELKRVLAVWHRRSGKDAVMLNHNACSAFERVGNYWYMMPAYAQCRKALWDAVNPHTGIKRLDEAFPHEVRENTLQQEMKIVFKNGSSFQLVGSDNYDTLVGSTPCGVSYSEYALSNPSSWGFIRPILLENDGWALFNSTPRGKNHLYKMMQLAQKSDEWFCQILPADKTKVFTNAELQVELEELQAEHGDTYGKALWLQEYFCSFEAAIPGAVWGDALTKLTLEQRVREVPHDPLFPVFTAWDLGRDDDTAIWFYQVIANEIRIINYYANNFKEIPFYADVLRGEEANCESMKSYTYKTHWVPHDARPKRLGMGGKSILQQFLEEDVGNFAVVPNLSIEDGIQAANATFPRCYFDHKCSDGVEHLKSYHRQYDEIKKVFSTSPVHDEHSHASDAFRYLSLTWRQSKAESIPMSQNEKFEKGNIRNVNFGAMKKAHFAKKRAERL